MRWMCVLYEGDPMTAGGGCAGPAWSRRGYLPADPGVEAALGWRWPYRPGRACWCDQALRTGLAA